MSRFRFGLLITIVLALPAAARAQATFHVSTDASLRTALTNTQNGDAIVFDNAITLTSGDLPAVQRHITIDGGGFALSGNNLHRGFFVAAFSTGTATPQPVNVTIQNITVQNTRAAGGTGAVAKNGGAGGFGGGGGGAATGVSGVGGGEEWRRDARALRQQHVPCGSATNDPIMSRA